MLCRHYTAYEALEMGLVHFTEWWSVDVKGLVKMIGGPHPEANSPGVPSGETYDGTEIWELSSYSAP